MCANFKEIEYNNKVRVLRRVDIFNDFPLHIAAGRGIAVAYFVLPYEAIFQHIFDCVALYAGKP